MDRALLDTSALSDAMRPSTHRQASIGPRLRQYLRAHGQLTFSFISYFEIVRGLQKKNAASRLLRFREFCVHSELLPISLEILERAASLWADAQNTGIVVGDGDLIIAATA